MEAIPFQEGHIEAVHFQDGHLKAFSFQVDRILLPHIE